ncbi:MAG: hypothetical protein AAF213_09255 [Pseudomonadota bacterium]
MADITECLMPTPETNRRWSGARQAAALASLVSAGVPTMVAAEEEAFNKFVGPQSHIAQIDPIQVQADGPAAEEQSVGAKGSAMITIARNNTGSMSDDTQLVGVLMHLLPHDAHAIAVEVPRPGALPECPEGQRCFTPLEFVEHVQSRVAFLGQETASFMRGIEQAMGQEEGPSALLTAESFGEAPYEDFGSVRRWYEQTMINASRNLDAETFANTVDAAQMEALEALRDEVDVELRMLGILRGGVHQLQFNLDSGRLVPESQIEEIKPDPIRFESGPNSGPAIELRDAKAVTEPPAVTTRPDHQRRIAV